jgi:5-methylcytosine-specific restriction protein A
MARLKTLPQRLEQVPERVKIVMSSGWRAGKTTAARGYGHRWRCYREAYLLRHPLCVMCADRGLTVAATVVDHRIPHKGDEALFWNENNHQSLCKPCHDGDKARQEHSAGQRTP